jgi:hypothetical protein
MATDAVNETELLKAQIKYQQQQIDHLRKVVLDVSKARPKVFFGEVSPPWHIEPIWGRLQFRAELLVPGWDPLTAQGGLDEQVWRMAHQPMGALGILLEEAHLLMLRAVQDKLAASADGGQSNGSA